MSWLAIALLALPGVQAGTADAALRGPVAGTAAYPSPAFDDQGRLWLAYVHDDFIWVTRSEDQGASFAPAVRVNPEPEPVDANGEGRPKIAIGGDGAVLLTWTRRLEAPFTGLVRFSRSEDGGRTFSTPRTLNDDGLETGHRFDALAVSPAGNVLVAWIDKRDLERAMAEGRGYEGAAIYTALSRDGGRTFEPNRKLDDHVCECCRLAFAFDPRGRAVLLFRDLLPGGLRDHSLAWGVGGETAPEIRRASFDAWRIDACPHHGPSGWIDPSGVLHFAWFTAGERSGAGVFYSRSVDRGETFESPILLGAARRGASHPFVLGIGAKVYIAWREFDGRQDVVLVQRSTDGGRSWKAPAVLARGTGSDHPLLVSDGRRVFLSWFSQDAGYRLLPCP